MGRSRKVDTIETTADDSFTEEVEVEVEDVVQDLAEVEPPVEQVEVVDDKPEKKKTTTQRDAFIGACDYILGELEKQDMLPDIADVWSLRRSFADGHRTVAWRGIVLKLEGILGINLRS